MFQQCQVTFFQKLLEEAENMHNEFREFCPKTRKICLKPLVKVLKVICTELTTDRAEDTQPHINISLKEQ